MTWSPRTQREINKSGKYPLTESRWNHIEKTYEAAKEELYSEWESEWTGPVQRDFHKLCPEGLFRRRDNPESWNPCSINDLGSFDREEYNKIVNKSLSGFGLPLISESQSWIEQNSDDTKLKGNSVRILPRIAPREEKSTKSKKSINIATPAMENLSLIKIKNGILFRENCINYAVEFTPTGNLSIYFAATDRVPNERWIVQKRADKNSFCWDSARQSEQKIFLLGKNTTVEMTALPDGHSTNLYAKIVQCIGVHQIREEKITITESSETEIAKLFCYKQKKEKATAAEDKNRSDENPLEDYFAEEVFITAGEKDVFD